jgi:hypothetical protein
MDAVRQGRPQSRLGTMSTHVIIPMPQALREELEHWVAANGFTSLAAGVREGMIRPALSRARERKVVAS